MQQPIRKTSSIKNETPNKQQTTNVTMQPTTILAILGLAAVFALANPVANPEAFGVESGHEARELVGMYIHQLPPHYR